MVENKVPEATPYGKNALGLIMTPNKSHNKTKVMYPNIKNMKKNIYIQIILFTISEKKCIILLIHLFFTSF